MTFFARLRRDWQMHTILLIPLIYVIIFYYGPMYGAQMAFRNYRPKLGITGSEWVGLKWFAKFLSEYKFKEIFSNTVLLSLYTIAIGFPLPIIFALLLNSVNNARFKKLTQNICYIPHFLSIVVLVNILKMILSPTSGVYGTIYHAMGGLGLPKDIISMQDWFRPLYVWSGVWQNLCWDSIIYTAALSSVSQDLHEAAMIDGASKWQRILHVDFPSILPTCAIMLILRFGNVMTVGFEKVYLMQSELNKRVSEVISTYVYKVAMGNAKDFSYGAAIGLFNSVINCALLVFVNWLSRKLSDNEVSMF